MCWSKTKEALKISKTPNREFAAAYSLRVSAGRRSLMFFSKIGNGSDGKVNFFPKISGSHAKVKFFKTKVMGF